MITNIIDGRTRYESIKTVTEPKAKQSGQLGGKDSSPILDRISSESKRMGGSDSKAAENIRYGQGISEGGMGGQTTTSSGTAQQGQGFGGTEAVGDEGGKSSRREQGYGPGSGVGG